MEIYDPIFDSNLDGNKMLFICCSFSNLSPNPNEDLEFTV